MNSIQNYVLESLFERNQITKEKLAQALDTFSNEPAEDLDVEKIKGSFIENGYTFDIY